MTTETMEQTSETSTPEVTIETLNQSLNEAEANFKTADKEYVSLMAKVGKGEEIDPDSLYAAIGKRKQTLNKVESAKRAIDRFNDDLKLEQLSGVTTGLKQRVEEYMNESLAQIKEFGLKGLNVSINFETEDGKPLINVTRPGTRVSTGTSGERAPRSKSTFDGMSAAEFIKARGADGEWTQEQIEKRSEDKNNVMHYARVLGKKLNVAEVKA